MTSGLPPARAVLAALLSLMFVLAIGPGARGQSIYVDPRQPVADPVLSLPYAFYNENFGYAAGWVHAIGGMPEPQSTLLATGIVGSAGSGMATLLGRDIRVPGTDRFFVDPMVSVGYFNTIESYIDGDPKFPSERAGSNQSDEDNFVDGTGWDNQARLRFKYVLPIGFGHDEIITTQKIDRGLPMDSRAADLSWNPLESGKSYVEVRPFYRWQEIDSDEVKSDLKTNGLELSYFWDNRDFVPNPSVGNSLRLVANRDFGLFDSSDSWSVVQAEIDGYLPLGATKRFRQRVIAFDFWTVDSPSWDVRDSGEIRHRPPPYTGATLGGLWRMRGFPSQRFNDKAAIYYALELRLIPEWNPFTNWPTLQKHLGVQWLQFVPFVEVGRVAPSWDAQNLHQSMQWDVGFGIRAWAKGLVVRLDTAVSNEGAGVQMMVAQPFQF
jgi:hypothetical protein